MDMKIFQTTALMWFEHHWKTHSTNENKDVMPNNTESQESDVFTEVFARVW